ncbi:uncharacterized protein LOC129756409 [Uranotaenia lowii]|uniref:uncharacterized protein LOC129756409 n=1 Tax=Uranotaenia lowii TaxID=190385 RepID=UPI00247AA66E|nr:uncharacterized protein LOC129756409 [Uranotaenia lowii]
MDIFQNQCSESLGFDSMLSNPLNSPLPITDSSSHINFSSSPFFSSMSSIANTLSSAVCSSSSANLSTMIYSTGTSTGANDIVLPSIFVKVPMQINQQYQQQQRQTRSSVPEAIKCEDKSQAIKRELGDLRALEKGTAMVQLPNISDRYLTEDSVEETTAEFVQVHKCECCPFVTIVADNLRHHVQSKHPNGTTDRQCEVLKCPACENSFWRNKVVELHLQEDHQMDPNEVRTLMQSRFPLSPPVDQITVRNDLQNTIGANTEDTTQPVSDPNQRRIFIRDVQLLKKPDVIEQEHVQQQAQQQDGLSSQHNGKIYIRNVSQLQNASFVQSEEIFRNPSGLHESKYSFVVPAPSPNSESPPISTIGEATSSTPQRSKIFVPNVEILRNTLLPITPPTIISSCDISRTSSSESLYTTPPPSVISPANSVTHIGGPYVSTGSALNMVILPAPVCSSNSSTPPTTATPPAITVANHDGTHSQQPPRNKIFIKNISVLKQPTIHLKSVDELNLMTIDQLQLQNLLPNSINNTTIQNINVDNISVNHQQEHQPMETQELNEFSGALEEAQTEIDDVGQYDDPEEGSQYETQISNCQSVEQGFVSVDPDYQTDFGHDFIIIEPTNHSTEVATSVEFSESVDEHMRVSSNLTEEQTNLNAAPSAHDMSNEAKQYEQTDEDILFVCAEEIINLDPPVLPEKTDISDFQSSENQVDVEDPQNVSQLQGRIYVSENLMDPQHSIPTELPQNITEIDATAPTLNMYSASDQVGSDTNTPIFQKLPEVHLTDRERIRSRGRPKGAKQTGITKLKKLYTNLTPLEKGYKCDLADCGARFKKPETLTYHRQCHILTEGGQHVSEGIQCPECGSCDFRNWNTLHTHLWREHTVDMELYSCHLCNFKTPVLCRLNNTHMKIHFDEKNFICVVCDKAFKNNKQLRNHRRSHRDPILKKAKERPTEEPIPTLQVEETPSRSSVLSGKTVKCVQCGIKYQNKRALKEHVEKNHGNEEGTSKNGKCKKCNICGILLKTRYLLQSHKFKHSDEKKFKCGDCDYSTNDHNAIRRHKLRHNSDGHMYRCTYCDYSSIQSTSYRKHLQRVHSDVASKLLYSCSQCAFVSISEVKYLLHRAKHEAGVDLTEDTPELNPTGIQPSEEIENTVAPNPEIPIEKNSSEEQPLQDAFALIPSVISVSNDLQNQHPLIRPAGFANNFSKVDNFYGSMDPQHYLPGAPVAVAAATNVNIPTFAIPHGDSKDLHLMKTAAPVD